MADRAETFEEVCLRELREELAYLERSYRTGKKPRALLNAVVVCARANIVMPEWVAAEIKRQWALESHGTLRSWHDVFGRPTTKARYHRLLRDFAAMPKAWAAVDEAQGPIDNDLFEAIGLRLQIGSREKTKKLYRAWCTFAGKPRRVPKKVG